MVLKAGRPTGRTAERVEHLKSKLARSLSDLLRHAVIYRHELVFILEQ
jgi:hypothetical protein